MLTIAIIGATLIILVLIINVFIIYRDKELEEEKQSNPLIDFLEKADDAYIRSHKIQQVAPFVEYANDLVCNWLLDSIRSKRQKLFGTEKYRVRFWKVIREEEGKFIVQKNLAHRYIHVRKGVQVSIGEDLQEIWTVIKKDDGYQVVNIKQIIVN